MKRPSTASRPVFGSALADFIPYRMLINSSVVTTRDGDLVASWKVAGLDCSTLGEAEISDLHEDLCQLVDSLARERCAIWIHRIRRRVTAHLPVELDQLPPAAAMIHHLHEANLTQRGLFVNEIFLSVVCRSANWAGHRGEPADLDKRLAHFGDLTRLIEATLVSYRPHRLGLIERNGMHFSEQLGLYGFLINGVEETIPKPWKTIAPALATSTLVFHDRHVAIQGASRQRCALILDLKEYPAASAPGMLDQILGGPYEVIETQSFLPMDRRAAQSYLTRQRNQLISSNDASVSQIDEILSAQDGVASTDFVLGEYHYTATVFGADESEAHAALASLRSRMNDAGFQSSVIDLIADLAWFSQLPGNSAYRPRIARLSSRNFCALSPLHGHAIGKPDKNPWGQAVTLLEGVDRAPVYFNFHVTPEQIDSAGDMAPGNTLIIGPTGSGKTVLELFLLCEAMKFEPRLMLFDKDRSSEIALRAMGIRYRVLAYGRFTGINPLALEATSANIAFMQRWVLSLCKPSVRALPGTVTAIEHAVDVICGFFANQRDLSVVLQNIPIAHSELRDDLGRWCRGGALGWAFDQTADYLRRDGTSKSRPSRIGIDLTAFYSDPELLTPIILALLETLDDWVDGQPYIYVVTECWAALDDPLFASFIRDKQKTIRKQNGIGLFDTQSPQDLLSSRHAAALIEQTATMILLPNPRATAADYCDGLKCTPSEFALLKSFGSNDRRFLIKQGNQCLVASLDLSSAPDALTMLSSDANSVRLLEQVLDHPEETFADWWPRLLKCLATRRLSGTEIIP